MKLTTKYSLNINPFLYAGLPEIKLVKLKEVERVNKIINIVCGFFGQDPEIVKSKTRKQEVVDARHFCRYLCHIFTKLSHRQIGAHFAANDHASVTHSIKEVRKMIDPVHSDMKSREDLVILCSIIEDSFKI